MGPCKPSKANKAQSAQNAKESVKHSNPWHRNSYLVRHKDQEYIETEYPIEEHGYKDWHSLTKNAMKYPNSSFHYLPHDANYVKPKDKNGTGHVVVRYLSFRFNILTMASPSLRKSDAEDPRRPISKKDNYTTYSMRSLG